MTIPRQWEEQWLSIEDNMLRTAALLRNAAPLKRSVLSSSSSHTLAGQVSQQEQLDDRMRAYHKVQRLCSSPLRAGGQGARDFVVDRLQLALQKWIWTDVLQPLELAAPQRNDVTSSPTASPQTKKEHHEESVVRICIEDWASVASQYVMMQRLIHVWFLYLDHNSGAAVQRLYRGTWKQVIDHPPNGTALQQSLKARFLDVCGGPSVITDAEVAGCVFSMIDEVGASFLMTPVCEQIEEYCRRKGSEDCVELLRGVQSPHALYQALGQLVERINHLAKIADAFFGGSDISRMRSAAAMQSFFDGFGDSLDSWRASLSAPSVLAFWIDATEPSSSTSVAGETDVSMLLLLRVCHCSPSVFQVLECALSEALKLHFHRLHDLDVVHSTGRRTLGQLVVNVCGQGEYFIERRIAAVDIRRKLNKGFLTALQQFVVHHDGELVPSLSRELLEQLKAGPDEATQDFSRRQIDALATVITLLPSKDVFVGHFAAVLARYLLHVALDSPSIGTPTAEEQCGVLQRVACRVGLPLMLPLITMVRDVRVSQSSQLHHGLDVEGSRMSSVTLLISSRWKPLLLSDQGALWTLEELELLLNGQPARSLSPLCDAAKALETLHQGAGGATRRFSWCVSVGTVHVAAHYESNAVLSLRLSPVVCIVLGALWDQCNSDSSRRTLDKLQKFLNSKISRRLTQAILANAATAGIIQVGGTDPADETSEADESYFIPNAPTTRSRKVRLVTPQQRSAVSAQASHADAERDEIPSTSLSLVAARKKKTEACVVRVMKRAKSMTHVALLERVAQELASQFELSAPMFKGCVGQLLEKEYLVRDESSAELYHYVA